jgi:hypothetical protein
MLLYCEADPIVKNLLFAPFTSHLLIHGSNILYDWRRKISTHSRDLPIHFMYKQQTHKMLKEQEKLVFKHLLPSTKMSESLVAFPATHIKFERFSLNHSTEHSLKSKVTQLVKNFSTYAVCPIHLNIVLMILIFL